MLLLSDRVLHTSRKEFLPLHNRGIPIPTKPTTSGGYLRQRRTQLRILQPEAARMLGVSMVTLSRWECDKVYPTLEFHKSITAYLGHDPFVTILNPQLKNLQSNESIGVANLLRPEQLGLAIKTVRLEQNMTGKVCAAALGVDVKTLRNWESGKHSPIRHLRKRVNEFVGYDPF